MGLTVIPTGGQSFVAQVRCDDCGAEAPKVERPDRLQARRRAVRSAEDEGFAGYQQGRTWVCPACRVRRIPDGEKPLFPKLCARYGVPLPAPQPEPDKNDDRPPAESNACPRIEKKERPKADCKDRPRTKKRQPKGD